MCTYTYVYVHTHKCIKKLLQSDIHYMLYCQKIHCYTYYNNIKKLMCLVFSIHIYVNVLLCSILIR